MIEMNKYENYIVETQDIYETKIKFLPKSGIISGCAAVASSFLLHFGIGVDLIPAIGTSALAAITAFLLTGWKTVPTEKVIGEKVKIRLTNMTLGEYGDLAKDNFAKASTLEYDEETGDFYIWGYLMK